MKVTLIGMGCGTEDTMTIQAKQALESAEQIIAAKGLLARMPDRYKGERIAAVWPQDILDRILEAKEKSVCVAFSGDSGFHSGTRNLVPLLREADIPFELMPGISSVQMLAAKLGRPWQDWLLVSAHGKQCDAVEMVMQGRPVFFLTGGEMLPSMLCTQLVEAGLGDLTISVGENLSYDSECISIGTAEEFAMRSFAPLTVMLAEAAPQPYPFVSGIEDGEFTRGDVPMSKQEVREAVRARLAIRRGETVWDIGAGTGSVSVELAMATGGSPVYAVERAEEGVKVIRANKEKFGVWNLHVVPGMAEDVIRDLPAPDAVFIGGSRGQLDGIIEQVIWKNPNARICISAILLETMSEAVEALAGHGLEVHVSQISCANSKVVGKKHMMIGNNPIFLICGERKSLSE